MCKENMTISIKQQLTESVILEGLQIQNVHHVYIMYIYYISCLNTTLNFLEIIYFFMFKKWMSYMYDPAWLMYTWL